MLPTCNLKKDFCCKECTHYGVCYRNCLFQTITCDGCDYKILKRMKENKEMKNTEQIFFAGMNESVIIPSKKEENAGYDIYANFEDDYMTIPPHETVMIPTGIVSACDPKYYFQLFERGSTGTKGIAQRCGVIDSGYRGEWFVPLTNTTEKPIFIMKKGVEQELREDYLCSLLLDESIVYPYEKAICQAVLIEVPKVEVITLTVEEIKNMASERGEGKIGSSGK